MTEVATPLLEFTCHMGSHSVTCHPAEVTFQPLPQPKLVLDLVTQQGCKAELARHIQTVSGTDLFTYTQTEPHLHYKWSGLFMTLKTKIEISGLLTTFKSLGNSARSVTVSTGRVTVSSQMNMERFPDNKLGNSHHDYYFQSVNAASFKLAYWHNYYPVTVTASVTLVFCWWCLQQCRSER